MEHAAKETEPNPNSSPPLDRQKKLRETFYDVLYIIIFFLLVFLVILFSLFGISAIWNEHLRSLVSKEEYVTISGTKTITFPSHIHWDEREYAVQFIEWKTLTNTTKKQGYVIHACAEIELAYPGLIGMLISGNYERKLAPIRPCLYDNQFNDTVFAISHQDSVHIAIGGPYVTPQNMTIQFSVAQAKKNEKEGKVENTAYSFLVHCEALIISIVVLFALIILCFDIYDHVLELIKIRKRMGIEPMKAE